LIIDFVDNTYPIIIVEKLLGITDQRRLQEHLAGNHCFYRQLPAYSLPSLLPSHSSAIEQVILAFSFFAAWHMLTNTLG
jgi:hypothetical protein